MSQVGNGNLWLSPEAPEISSNFNCLYHDCVASIFLNSKVYQKLDVSTVKTVKIKMQILDKREFY